MTLSARLHNFDVLSRTVVIGAFAGLAGGAAKILGELIFPPRATGEPIPPVVMFSKITMALTGSPILPRHELLASQLFHWPFSIGAGIVYCSAAEYFPRITMGRGVGFGLVLLLCTHETLLPWLGLSLPWSEIPLKEHLSEICTHCIFGFVVELVRRRLRAHSRLNNQVSLKPTT